jgi:hypothetical protein
MFATDEHTGLHMHGKFDFGEGEELDELSIKRYVHVCASCLHTEGV